MGCNLVRNGGPRSKVKKEKRIELMRRTAYFGPVLIEVAVTIKVIVMMEMAVHDRATIWFEMVVHDQREFKTYSLSAN
ncbi:unnamed protein product [Rhizophagus irregularis]|nr:unnamed protein product [Rhizophagus irregularis]